MKLLTFEVPAESKDTDFNKIVADSDSMETPPALFRAIEKHFSDAANKGFYEGFNLDAAAAHDGRNSKVSAHYLGNGLNNDWNTPDWQSLDPYLAPRKKGRVWCNPPYSNVMEWIQKAHEETHIKGNAEIAVLLLRYDPSTTWYGKCEQLADIGYILKGRRIKFQGRFKKADGTYSKNSASNHPHFLAVFCRDKSLAEELITRGDVTQPVIYHQTDEFTIYNGNALQVLRTLPDESVNCIVTSPPYWGQRDYGVEGQIGLEQTIEEHFKALMAVFRECHRVLRKDGTCWVNYGDAYSGSGKGKNGDGSLGKLTDKQSYNEGAKTAPVLLTDIEDQCLMLLPFRFCLAMVDELGFIMRNDIIWHKPNPMTESVKNRCSKAHEYIFFFTKIPSGYYFEQIMDLRVSYDLRLPKGSEGCFTPHKARRDKGNNKSFRGGQYTNGNVFVNDAVIEGFTGQAGELSPYVNKRTVWTVGTESTTPWYITNKKHHARFPERLIEPCILAGCPEGGTVLDPFAGTSTTGAVALKHGNKYIAIELNPADCETSKTRLSAIPTLNISKFLSEVQS